MPKVSIITTAYKHEKFIAETIESILSQTFTDWELLIGDDSPDDKTWKIIKKYTNKFPNKIKAWHNKTNKGIAENMNFLISKSNNDSKYIAFLEGDDLFIPKSLENIIKIYKNNKEVKFIVTNYDNIGNNSKIIKKNFSKIFINRKSKFKKGINNYKLEDFILLREYPRTFGTISIKKDFYLESNLIFLNLNKNFHSVDRVFYNTIFNNNTFYYYNKINILYRNHGNNISGIKGIQKNINEEKLYYNYLLSIGDNRLNKLLVKNINYVLNLGNAVGYIKIGQKKEALNCLINTLKLYLLLDFKTKFKILFSLFIPNIFLKKIGKKIVGSI